MNNGHLVVIGGSIAGLMAAVASSGRFERVTIVERDHYVDDSEPRAGVPQGTQVHVILPLGLDLMESLLPGIRRDFLDAGCLEFDELAEVPMMSETGWKLRVESSKAVAFRRPVLERVIRRRALELDGVKVLHASARGYELSEDGSRIVGVRLRDGSVIEADFVIDASGRRSKGAKWLGHLGFEAPVEVRANAFMGYATRFVRIPPGVMDDISGFVVHPIPGHHQGGVLLPADNGVFQLSAIGMMRDYPPRDPEGFLDFLDRARTPLLGQVARQCEPVSEIRVYHQDGNLRRRWEDTVLPLRLLMLGDAVASFNPIYGQGLTLSSSGATLLRKVIDEGSGLDELASAVQHRLAEVVSTAFKMSATVDSMFEGSECVNVDIPTHEDRELAEAIDALATLDPEVASAVGVAAFWIDPAALQTPSILAKVKAWLAGDRCSGGLDMSTYPRTVTPLRADAPVGLGSSA